jgi:hypothetical protein
VAPDSLTVLAGNELTLQTRLRTKKLLEALPSRLDESERVVHLAGYSHGGLVAATVRRLIVMRSVDDVDEIPYQRMISFAAGKEGRKPFIQIQTEAGEVMLKGLGGGFEEICRLVHSRMWDVSMERLTEPAQVEPLRRAAGGAA